MCVCVSVWGGGVSRGEGKTEDKWLFSPFQENSLVSAPLSSEADRLRLRGNGCINATFSLSCLLPLPHSGDRINTPHPSTTTTPSFYPVSRSLAFIFTGAFWRPPIFFTFICNNHVGKEFLSHPLKFARTLHFAHKKNSDWTGWRKGNIIMIKNGWPFWVTLVCMVHCYSVSSCHTPAVSVKELCDALHWALCFGLDGLCVVLPLHRKCVCMCTCGRETEMDGFCGQMCMKSGANGVRSLAAGRGQGVGLRRRWEIYTHTHTCNNDSD